MCHAKEGGNRVVIFLRSAQDDILWQGRFVLYRLTVSQFVVFMNAFVIGCPGRCS